MALLNDNPLNQTAPNVPKIRQKKVKVEINGEEHIFLINCWNLSTFNRNLPIVGKYIGQPLSIIYGSQLAVGDTAGLADGLPMALMQLLSQLDNDGLNQFYKVMFADVWYDAKTEVASNMSAIFDADPLAAFDLLVFVLQENLGSFFKRKGFLSRLAQAGQMASGLSQGS